MTSPGKLESETPETDALTTAPVDPAVNYASAKLTKALNLCASLERRLRAATQPVADAELHRVAGEILAARIAAERERRKTDYVLFDKLRTMIGRLSREKRGAEQERDRLRASERLLRMVTEDEIRKRVGVELAALKSGESVVMPSAEDMLGAVARGWTHPQNASKEFDADLAIAIAAEFRAMLAARKKGA